MVTINGNRVPEKFGSITDLPSIIEALDHDQTALPDGNYTEDELGWLHQFHTLCDERHFINAADIESAGIHGPKIFRDLGPRQKADLASYFNQSFLG